MNEDNYMSSNHLAVIDLGTNTFHLLIASINADSSYQITFKQRVPVMIGKDGITHGLITEDAQQRAISTLKKFRNIIDQAGVKDIYATATSAFRNARNGKQLIEKIKKETGITITVISGDLEADYIFLGVSAALDLEEENALIMDIGGGSVEFIICNKKDVLWKQSFEIGAQRLLDLFHVSDPISDKNIAQLQEYFEQQLGDLKKSCQLYQPQTLIGASGTFDTLSDIYVHEEQINVPEHETELPLSYAHFFKMHAEISRKSREERLKIPGMIEMRVDMIVVATWLIHYVLQQYQIKKIRVSAFALKEGLLRKLIEDFTTSGN